MRSPGVTDIQAGWIDLLDLLITTAVFLIWYHLDPSTPQIALR